MWVLVFHNLQFSEIFFFPTGNVLVAPPCNVLSNSENKLTPFEVLRLALLKYCFTERISKIVRLANKAFNRGEIINITLAKSLLLVFVFILSVLRVADTPSNADQSVTSLSLNKNVKVLHVYPDETSIISKHISTFV